MKIWLGIYGGFIAGVLTVAGLAYLYYVSTLEQQQQVADE